MQTGPPFSIWVKKGETAMGVAVFTFAAFAASQVGTPGPANMALLATGARYGFRAALPFVGGVVLGKQLIIWPIGFGLMALQFLRFVFGRETLHTGEAGVHE